MRAIKVRLLIATASMSLIVLIMCVITFFKLTGNLSYQGLLSELSYVVIFLWLIYFVVVPRRLRSSVTLFLAVVGSLSPLLMPQAFRVPVLIESVILKHLLKIIYGVDVSLLPDNNSVIIITNLAEPVHTVIFGPACSSLEAFLVYTPLLLYIKGKTRSKVLAAIITFPLVLLVNMGRILATIELSILGLDFEYAHAIAGVLSAGILYFVINAIHSSLLGIDLYEVFTDIFTEVYRYFKSPLNPSNAANAFLDDPPSNRS